MKLCECGCGEAVKPSQRFIRGHNGRRPIEDRFFEKVVWNGGEDECWTWQGATNRKGYGELGKGDGSLILAHRFAWEFFNAPIPEGLFVCHRCDNPPCCNPAHLFLGTKAENNADMKAKGRHARGERNGHAKLTADDVRTIREWYPAGWLQRELAAAFGVSRSRISMLLSGNDWSHV